LVVVSVNMEKKRLSVVLAAVASAGLFLLVSGVGPVALSNLYIIAGLAAAFAIASCSIYPKFGTSILVCCIALYPYFLSYCSDVLHSGGTSAEFPCLLSPSGGISALVVGIPGMLIYAFPLAIVSYLGATQIVARFQREDAVSF
jgi:hypothetical protein